MVSEAFTTTQMVFVYLFEAPKASPRLAQGFGNKQSLQWGGGAQKLV